MSIIGSYLSTKDEDDIDNMTDKLIDAEKGIFKRIVGKDTDDVKDEYYQRLLSKIKNAGIYKKHIKGLIRDAKKYGRKVSLKNISVLAKEAKKKGVPKKYKKRIEIASKLMKPHEWNIQYKIYKKYSKSR
jgi:hypothetical protein